MSAAVRIQLMLLARKNNFGKKSHLADPASSCSQHRFHSNGPIHSEQTSLVLIEAPAQEDRTKADSGAAL